MLSSTLIIIFQMDEEIPGSSMAKNPSSFQMGVATNACSVQDIQDDMDTTELYSDIPEDPEDDSNILKMFEAYSAENSKQKGLLQRFLKIFLCTECPRKKQSS